MLERQVEKMSLEVTEARTYEDKWREAESRVAELTAELHSVESRLLERASSSQRREAEREAETLQAQDGRLSEDLARIIGKLGDPEEQEIIHGALVALERENKVLKLRNAEIVVSLKEQTNNVPSESLESARDNKETEQMQSSQQVDGQAEEQRVSELSEKLAEQENKLSLLEQEKDALAAVVRDLKAQLAAARDESTALSTSLEELDHQHQDAIDQLLAAKKSLQDENDQLVEDVKSARQKQHFPIAAELDTVDYLLEWSLYEKVVGLLTLEIPEQFYDEGRAAAEGEGSRVVAALVRMSAECKWQRDTLEREVASLAKELRECREELSRAGGLAPIPENSEEAAALEEKVAVLAESRSNLEADAERLRGESRRLADALRAAEESLGNERNRNTETTAKLYAQIRDLEQKIELSQERFEEANSERLAAQARVQELEEKLERELQVNSDVKAQLLECEVDKSTLQQELEQVFAKVSALGDIDGLRQEHAALLQKHGQERSEWQARVAELEAQKSDLEGELLGLCNKNESLVESLDKELMCNGQLQSEVKELQMKAAEWERLLEFFKSSLAQKEEHCQEIVTVKEKLEKRCAEIEQESCYWEKKAQEAEKQLQEVMKTKDMLDEQIADRDRKICDQEHLRKEFETLSEEYDGVKRKMQEAEKNSCELELRVQESLRLAEEQDVQVSSLKDALSAASAHLEAEKLKRSECLAEVGQLRQDLDQARADAARLRHLYEDALVQLDESRRASDAKERSSFEVKEGEQQQNLQQAAAVVQDSETDSNRAAEKLDVDKEVREVESLVKSLDAGEAGSHSLKRELSELLSAKGDLESLLEVRLEELEGAKGRVRALEQELRERDAQLAALRDQREELAGAVRQKHEESVRYHAEIQRLGALLGQELRRSEESRRQAEDKQKTLLDAQNELISVKQRLEKLEALASFQARDTAEELQAELSRRDEVIRSNSDTILAKDQELHRLQSQVNHLQSLLDAASAHERQSAENSRVADLEGQLTSVSEALQVEQSKSKYLEREAQDLREKEAALRKELDRLRLHLVGVEDSYTQEALRLEGQVQDLRQQLLQAEERAKSSSTAYTSVSVQANQQVETLQEQLRLVSQQREDAQARLSATEDQAERQAAALTNLQAVLKQFHRDKEREVMFETERIRQQLQSSHTKEAELAAEINSLRGQLAEAKEGLSAAARLGEQLDRKTDLVGALREEVAKLKQELSETEARVQAASNSSEGKVDRSLVKNLVLGYVAAPARSRADVLRVVATVLDFSEEERTRAGLPQGAGKAGGHTPSLSEAFVRFLESESQPRPQLRLLPERTVSQGSEPGRADDVSPGRRTPLLLHEVQLPSFNQFPVARNSSSILKDVLKDS
ncbi:thyroid receptor-interacting protein 11 isoform X2 [Bacillus rossius redtenbacheri]